MLLGMELVNEEITEFQCCTWVQSAGLANSSLIPQEKPTRLGILHILYIS